ncbi:MAG: LysR family transcriptional regulator [Bacteroidia bacterium]|nr:LysR family transcriptional regulator [Bacteroidia bacterium]
MLDFRLKVFLSAATHLSFTKASGELYITQPAVTKHIQELESELEVKLFERRGNKIALTQAGAILLFYAKEIKSIHNTLKFELSQLKGDSKGTLKIGASTTIAQYVIPSALAEFNRRYPHINLTVINGNTDYIGERLLKNEIDIGIVEGKPSNGDIKYSAFLPDELLLFTSGENKKYPKTIKISGLKTLPLVLREKGSGTLEIIDDVLRAHRINIADLNVKLYLASTEGIKAYVKASVATGIVSRYAIEPELSAGTFRQVNIEDIHFYRQFYFIRSKGPEPQRLTKLFLNFLSNYFKLSGR